MSKKLPEDWETHAAHCCPVHGCKYEPRCGEKSTCPVVNGLVEREFNAGWCQEPCLVADPNACRLEGERTTSQELLDEWAAELEDQKTEPANSPQHGLDRSPDEIYARFLQIMERAEHVGAFVCIGTGVAEEMDFMVITLCNRLKRAEAEVGRLHLQQRVSNEPTTENLNPADLQMTLSVLVFKERSHWIAHGLETDVATQGSSPDDVIQAFIDAMDAMCERLGRSAHVGNLLRPAPPESWRQVSKAKKRTIVSRSKPYAKVFNRIVFLQIDEDEQ